MLIFLIWSFVPTLLVRRLSFCPSSSCFMEAVQYRISQESVPTEADRYGPLILAKTPTKPTSSHFSIIGTVQSHLQAAQWVQYMPQDWQRDVNGTAEVFRDINIFRHISYVWKWMRPFHIIVTSTMQKEKGCILKLLKQKNHQEDTKARPEESERAPPRLMQAA